MRKLIVGIAATLLIAGGCAAQQSASGPRDVAQQIHGHWKVVGVAVSDEGVQALSMNDPAYMDRTLTFSNKRLSWDKPVQAATEAPCADPILTATSRNPDSGARTVVRKIGGPAMRAVSVACASGSWGPNAAPAPAFLLFSDGTLGLWWYDGGLLKLRRVGRG